jgi:hypothetical protein
VVGRSDVVGDGSRSQMVRGIFQTN